MLPVPDKPTKSQLVSQDLWGVFQVVGNNCDFPDDSCRDVTGEHSLRSTLKAQRLLLTLLHVSESSSGGQEEEGREKEKEEVGSGEGGKENTAKVEGRVTPLRNISKKTAKRILELISDESVRDNVAHALTREQACCPGVALACGGSLLSSTSWGEGFCMALPCYAKQPVVRLLPHGPGEDLQVFPLSVAHI